jgi:hypothetical protein
MDDLIDVESRVAHSVAAAVGDLAVAIGGSRRGELPVNYRIARCARA